MIKRRHLLLAFASGLVASRTAAREAADELGRLLTNLETDPDAVAKAKGFNELASLSFVPSPEILAQRPELPRTFRRPSRRAISDQTRRLLVSTEVSSRARYESRLQAPVWPGGQSGATIAIGYDMGYVTPSQFRTDWTGFIDADRVGALEVACGIKGGEAKTAADKLSHVRISWDEAVRQFDYFIKIYMNLVEATFPNCNQLSDDSFGALTSIVYNRGNAMTSGRGDAIDRRREMREIRDLMKAEQYSRIPDRIRAMKRIWEGQPDTRGLLIRRDAEAKLFELGLGAA